jgi:hypothetical protein
MFCYTLCSVLCGFLFFLLHNSTPHYFLHCIVCHFFPRNYEKAPSYGCLAANYEKHALRVIAMLANVRVKKDRPYAVCP